METGKYPYIVRLGSNNGQKGFINESERFLNDGNTLSFGQDTATVYYQEFPYFTGDKIKVLKPKNSKFCKKNAQFFVVAISKAFSTFSWGTSSFCVEIIQNQMLKLPVTSTGEIDFDFMNDFIAELEAERTAELEAYLQVTGLSDYVLTDEEEKALEDYKNGRVECQRFKFSNLFNHIKQGRRLKTDDQIKGNIPFVMSGTTNTGVVGYISNPVASFPKNAITIDIFGNAFYRDYAFGAGDDTGVYWNDIIDYSRATMLYYTTAMGKALYGKYSFGKKLRSSQSFDFTAALPTKNGQPDYSTMDVLISAVQKLVIKDVVKYAGDKIKNTAQVIANNK